MMGELISWGIMIAAAACVLLFVAWVAGEIRDNWRR